MQRGHVAPGLFPIAISTAEAVSRVTGFPLSSRQIVCLLSHALLARSDCFHPRSFRIFLMDDPNSDSDIVCVIMLKVNG
jgi:hypothetical protein